MSCAVINTLSNVVILLQEVMRHRCRVPHQVCHHQHAGLEPCTAMAVRRLLTILEEVTAWSTLSKLNVTGRTTEAMKGASIYTELLPNIFLQVSTMRNCLHIERKRSAGKEEIWSLLLLHFCVDSHLRFHHHRRLIFIFVRCGKL